MTSSSAHFSVALLAFDNMEALDFAGPFEVFTTAPREARMAVSLGWNGTALDRATVHQMDDAWAQA